jgi:hypothetical protein
MLIAIDRSFGQFDRALISLATNFRGAFRSRAGGFKAPMVSTFAWAIASMIANAAMATAAKDPEQARIGCCLIIGVLDQLQRIGHFGKSTQGLSARLRIGERFVPPLQVTGP